MQLLLQSLYMPIRPFFKAGAILSVPMRRLVFILLAVGLAAPAAALAVKDLPGDGTLVVDNARGLVTVRARGGIIGRFDSGRVTLVDPIEGDGSGPIVYGAEKITEVGPHTTLYVGEDVRFRLIGGAYRVTVNGYGVDVSAVGRGTVTLDGSGFSEQPGRFQINGGSWQPMPDEATRYTLGQTQLPSGQDKEKPQPGGPHGP
jgi:hypothetical protein